MKTKIKILQFPIANSNGGITHYAINNWICMDKDRFECDFATMSKELSFASELKKTGAEIFYISDYPSNNMNQFVKEFNNILDNNYDVVHLHTAWWKNCVVEELCMERGVKKVIVHAHNTYCDVQDKFNRELNEICHNRVKERFSENMATDFWACSKVAADWLFGPQIPHDRIKIMPNAIKIDMFRYNEETRKRKREELGIDDNTFVIGCVGRLSYQKNQALLIEAFAKAIGCNKKVLLMIIGNGDLKNELEQKVIMSGIADNTKFLGFRTDTFELYQAMDVFTLPSRFEGLPIAAVEAQCAGLKCLISRNVTDEVGITNNVIWVNDNLEDWTKAIAECAKFYAREDMSDVISRAGYDIEKQIKIIENEYSK